jgi:hypothetical protein
VAIRLEEGKRYAQSVQSFLSQLLFTRKYEMKERGSTYRDEVFGQQSAQRRRRKGDKVRRQSFRATIRLEETIREGSAFF